MAPEPREFLRSLRRAIREDRVRTPVHFRERLATRALLWADVLAVALQPSEVRPDGLDRYGREKWAVSGKAAGELDIELICVLDKSDDGEWVIFITIYFL